MDLDQLLDERLDLDLVDAKLETQGAERDAPVAFQERPGLLDCLQKAHLILAAQIRFYALGNAPGQSDSLGSSWSAGPLLDNGWSTADVFLSTGAHDISKVIDAAAIAFRAAVGRRRMRR